LDRRLGKASGKRVPSDQSEEVEMLYRTRYAGFTAKHFHEHLVQGKHPSWTAFRIKGGTYDTVTSPRDSRSVMKRIEVITSSERRRRWSREEKERWVEALEEPGA